MGEGPSGCENGGYGKPQHRPDAGQRLRQRVSTVHQLQDRRPDQGLLGIAIQPWRLLAGPSGYIYTWLLGFSGGLSSIAGVLVVDYWLGQRRERNLEDLYVSGGEYGGWNLAAIAATAISCALAWGGFVIPALKPLYDYAWFVGFFAADLAHLVMAPQPKSVVATA
jgi:cytosine/uracil/thiamine/allantoin permease